MIGNVLRMAGQRLLPIIAPAGGKQFAKEIAQGAALNLALEQGLPIALGQEARPLPESVLRSLSITALGGPIERGVIAGTKKVFPGLSTLEAATTRRLAGMGLPETAAKGAAGMAAATGRLGLGTLAQAALVEPLTNAVTRTVLPEGFGSGQNIQSDIPGTTFVPPTMPPMMPQTGSQMDPAEIDHRRKLELIYARNYKFPSYIHHVSQSTQNPFEIANRLVNVPTVNYF